MHLWFALVLRLVRGQHLITLTSISGYRPSQTCCTFSKSENPIRFPSNDVPRLSCSSCFDLRLVCAWFAFGPRLVHGRAVQPQTLNTSTRQIFYMQLAFCMRIWLQFACQASVLALFNPCTVFDLRLVCACSALDPRGPSLNPKPEAPLQPQSTLFPFSAQPRRAKGLKKKILVCIQKNSK